MWSSWLSSWTSWPSSPLGWFGGDAGATQAPRWSPPRVRETPRARPAPFQFLDAGPLTDGDLELVEPAEGWVSGVLAAAHDPLTALYMPREATTTREQIKDFLRYAPRGREPACPRRGRSDAYHFWMRARSDQRCASRPPPPTTPQPSRIAGAIALRVGRTRDLEMYLGHIGYHVYPAHRGHRFAERACRLLLPLARRHGLDEIWITVNPDNAASRRTCERLGAELVDVVPLPPHHSLYRRGDRLKCRYRVCIKHA